MNSFQSKPIVTIINGIAIATTAIAGAYLTIQGVFSCFMISLLFDRLLVFAGGAEDVNLRDFPGFEHLVSYTPRL